MKNENTMKEVIDYLKDEYTFLIYKNENCWASKGINPLQKLE